MRLEAGRVRAVRAGTWECSTVESDARGVDAAQCATAKRCPWRESDCRVHRVRVAPAWNWKDGEACVCRRRGARFRYVCVCDTSHLTVSLSVWVSNTTACVCDHETRE